MSLLSEKIRHYMRKSVEFGQKGHAHPFQWNEKLGRPELCRSKRGRFIWLVNSGLVIFYLWFILVQSVRVNLAEDSSKIQKIYMRFVVLNRIFTMFCQVANFVNRNPLPGFFCQFSMLMKQFQDDLRKSKDEEDKKLGNKVSGEITLIPKIYELFLDALWYNVFLGEFGLALLSILRPNSPEFLSAVLIPFAGERKILKMLLRIFSVLFQFHFEFLNAANIFLWVFSGFGSIFPGIVALRQIKCLISTRIGNGQTESNPSKLPKFSRVKVQRIMKMYRHMEILQKSLHDTFGTLIFPSLKFAALSVTIIGTYGGFKMDGILAILLGFIAVFVFSILVVFIETLAEFHKNSQEILFRMKSPQFQKDLNLYEKKMLKSFNLIQIKIGMGLSYVIDKRCVATVIKIVADSTVNFILANP